jgi:hypothetical protein
MNIFMLDKNPALAAQAHIDRHVVKMLTEYAQILSTVWRIHRPSAAIYLNNQGKIYKPTHRNHPSVKWAADCSENYAWLLQLWISLHAEYKFRYGDHKRHGAFMKTYDSLKYMPGDISIIPNRLGTLSETPYMAKEFQAVGPDYKHNDPVEAYRTYYRDTKTLDAKGIPMAIWTNRGKPEWF